MYNFYGDQLKYLIPFTIYYLKTIKDSSDLKFETIFK